MNEHTEKTGARVRLTADLLGLAVDRNGNEAREPIGLTMPKPSWEIAALRVVSRLSVYASPVAFVAAFMGGEGLAVTWSFILLFAGMFLRAAAGIWAALERIAPNPVVSEKPVRKPID